jgi:hypothetical protein
LAEIAVDTAQQTDERLVGLEPEAVDFLGEGLLRRRTCVADDSAEQLLAEFVPDEVGRT